MFLIKVASDFAQEILGLLTIKVKVKNFQQKACCIKPITLTPINLIAIRRSEINGSCNVIILEQPQH